jgi:hypothetical protein
MARSDTDLANAALSYLVRDRLRNLDGDKPEPVQMRENMEQAKQEVIEQYDWPDCRVVAPLILASGIDLRGWTYAYIEPADMIKPWILGDLKSPKSVPYERGMSSDLSSTNKYFFTDFASANIRYGSSRLPIGGFSAGVFDLIALKLALLTCMPLTKEISIHQYLSALFDKKLSAQKTIIANSEPEVVDLDFIPEAISVRSE